MTNKPPPEDKFPESSAAHESGPDDNNDTPTGSDVTAGMDTASDPDNLHGDDGFSPDHLESAQPLAPLPGAGPADKVVERHRATDDMAWHDSEDEEELWAMDDDTEQMPTTGAGLPLGLVAVAIVAILLLIFGGYGVMQERIESREEIRRLQAELGTSTLPEEAARAQQTLRTMEQRNEGLRASLENLELENRRLQETVAGLQARLAAQEQAPATATASTGKQPGSTAADPARQPDQAPPGGQDNAGTKAATNLTRQPGWFVNFSSYSRRSDAESWAGRLKPVAGSVVIAPGTKNGKTFYRVRVVGLKSEAEAKVTAADLERDYKLSGLWVGRQ
jgi:cell division protein FtsN